jgi:hypothetical protein
MVTEKDRDTLMRLAEEWPISTAGGLNMLRGRVPATLDGLTALWMKRYGAVSIGK